MDSPCSHLRPGCSDMGTDRGRLGSHECRRRYDCNLE
jgi:hypothetical protein